MSLAKKVVSSVVKGASEKAKKTEQVWVLPTRREPYDNSLKVFGSFSPDKEEKLLRRDEEKLLKLLSYTRGVYANTAETVEKVLPEFENVGYPIQGDKQILKKRVKIGFTKTHFDLIYPYYEEYLKRLYEGNFRFSDDGLNKYLQLNSKWFNLIDERVAVEYLNWSMSFYHVVQSFPKLASQLTVVDSLNKQYTI